MDKLLQKLQLIKENPDFYKGLTPEEQAELFLFLLQPKKLFQRPKTIKAVAGKDGVTPIKDVDYLSKEISLQFLTDIQKQVETRLESITDGSPGKDAVITPELIEDIVFQVTSQIEFPENIEFDSTSLVESIENLALDHEQLRDEVERIRLLSKAIIGGGAQVNWVKSYVEKALEGISVIGLAETFETVSKNLDSTDATLNYTGDDLTSIVYSNGITKTLNYTSDNLTSVVLSGATPSGISLTKTLTYTEDNLVGFSYS
jgi:hypothetical protein